MGRKPAMCLRRSACISFPNSVWERASAKLRFGRRFETEFRSAAFPNGVWERGASEVRRACVIGLTVFFLLSALCNQSSADQPPCVSGLREGQRPGPYSAVVATGPQRGQSYCYICETADRPAAVVFARSVSEPLGKLAERLDKA